MIKLENHWSTGKPEPTNLGSKDSAALDLNRTKGQNKAENPSLTVMSFKLLRAISSFATSVPSSARDNKNISVFTSMSFGIDDQN